MTFETAFIPFTGRVAILGSRQSPALRRLLILARRAILPRNPRVLLTGNFLDRT